MKSVMLCALVGMLLPLAGGAALDGLDVVHGGMRSERASSHDVSGGNDDSINPVAPGTTLTLLDTGGPGRITHMWFTVSAFPGHTTFLRDLVLRIYWEESPVPSVEVPLGDFFALGHGLTYQVNSAPISVGYDDKALNCYWPMPFYKHARIQLCNVGQRSIRRVFYNIDYETGRLPRGLGLFHAEYRCRRDLPPQSPQANTTGRDNYVILSATGTGQYVGCCLFVDAEPGGWWGEGDDMLFVDGNDRPSIIGTGSEDYFCDAWGFDAAYSYPYYGVPLLQQNPGERSRVSCYRFHIADPVRFGQSIKVTIEHLYGAKVKNDYSSVAYWYQDHPARERAVLPTGEALEPRPRPAAPRPDRYTLAAVELEASLRARGVPALAITTGFGQMLGGGYLQVPLSDRPVDVPLPVGRDGTYRVRVHPSGEDTTGPVVLQLQGCDAVRYPKGARADLPDVWIDLGVSPSRHGALTLSVAGSGLFGLDRIEVRRVSD